MADDKTVVLCGADNYTGADSIDVNCRKCNAAVILSDSTIRSLKQNDPELDLDKDPPIVLCVECGLEYINKSKAEGEELNIVPLTEEQLREFRQGLEKFNK